MTTVSRLSKLIRSIVVGQQETDRLQWVSIARTLLLGASSNGASILLGFVYTIVTTSVLYAYFGPAKFGAWVTVFSLVFALGFLNLGIGNAILNTISRTFQKDRRSITAAYVYSGLMLSVVAMVLVAAFGTVALSFINVATMFRHLPAAAETEVRHLLIAFLILYSLSFPTSILTMAVCGLQRQWIVNLSNCAGYGLATCAALTVPHFALSMAQTLVACYGTQLAAQMIPSAFLLSRHLRNAARTRRSRLQRFMLRLSRTASSFFLLQVAMTFAWLLDYVLLSQFVGVVAAGQFAIIQRLFQVIPAGTGVISSQLWPVFSLLRAGREFRKLRQLLYLAFFLTLGFAIPAAILIFAFRLEITQLWLGAAFEGFAMACALYALWVCMQAVGGLASIFLNASGFVAQQAAPALIFAGTSFALKVYLLPQYGIAGLVLSTVMAYALGNFILVLSLRSRIGDVLGSA